MSEAILGVHFSAGPDGKYTADGNVAVIVDGSPVFAVGQERVTRRKYDGGFIESARYALDAVGISISEVKAVAISTFGRPDMIGDPEQAEVERQVRDALGSGPSYQVIPSHHVAHALSAAAQCQYERALIAVIDNEGSVLGPRVFGDLWRHSLERTS